MFIGTSSKTSITWLALDPQRRAVAAILNGVRRPPPADGVRPSRGQLPLDALRGKPLPEILDRYDGFHLVLATAGDARIWTWDGESLRETGLDSGDHVIVNQGIDPSGHPATELLPAAQTRDDWVRLLGSDVVLIDRDYAGRRYGSTSTSLVVLDGSGVRYSFNPQPRDPTAWYDIPT
jgi:hypothetical protein